MTDEASKASPEAVTDEARALAGLEKMIVRIAHLFRRSGVDMEDLKQEGRLAAVAALRKHDASRGAASTLVYSSVANRLKNVTRYERPPMRNLRAAVRLDAPIGDEEGGSNYELFGQPADQEDRYAEAEEKALVLQFATRLEKEQREVIEGVLAGKSFREIGPEMGLSKSRVGQVYNAAVLRMKEMQHAACH